MSETHDQLLDTAISAHEELIQATELLKVQRQQAFRRAIAGPVTAREIANKLGISESYVGKIAKGLR